MKKTEGVLTSDMENDARAVFLALKSLRIYGF
jgi:hypothetical protein